MINEGENKILKIKKMAGVEKSIPSIDIDRSIWKNNYIFV